MATKLDSEINELEEYKNDLENEKRVRMDSLITNIKEKMNKKKDLEESIKKIEDQMRN